MTNSMLLTLMCIFVGHFLADFVFQTHTMAKNKSKSFKWLLIHIVEYGLVLSGFLFLTLNYHVWVFCLINTLCHLLVDFVTSKVSSHFHQKGDIHTFFVVIGFDQLLHTVCFLVTLTLL